jgi:putative CocE/NonD family hydrolase
MARRATIALAGLGLASIGLYAARRELIGRALGLRPASHAVALQADLAVPMADGVELLADRFYPQGGGPFPTIIIRTPYGRASELGAFGALYTIGAQLFAERGYNVLMQSVRGRFRSGGRFDPFVHEAADGMATLEWTAGQPWFDGSAGMWGPSYLGYCQWAVAAQAPPYLKAIVPMVTSARFSRLFFPEGAFAFESILRWTHLIHATSSSRLDLRALWRLSPLRREPAVAAAFAHLPVSEADAVAVGAPVSFFRRWMQEANLDGDYWQGIDRHRSLAKVDVPVHLVAGWYDIFLNGQLADYMALLAAGKRPYLTVLPRHHLETMLIWEGLREGLDWFDAHMRGDESRLRRRPVRLALMGSNEHHEMDFWPPPAPLIRYYLAGGGGLGAEIAPATGGSTYTYNPADPTPGIGGPVLSAGAGRRDQGRVEARADVLSFTTPPLAAAVDVIGPVRAELYVRSSLAHTDFVARLCRVGRDGHSSNVCDGLFRLEPGKGVVQADGSLRIEVDMWATAQRFAAGERIRLVVCSAAHPRWSRNLGHGAPFGHSQAGPPAEQTIYHDAEHPSALVLPVMTYVF